MNDDVFHVLTAHFHQHQVDLMTESEIITDLKLM